jgi:hypothetical protein
MLSQYHEIAHDFLLGLNKSFLWADAGVVRPPPIVGEALECEIEQTIAMQKVDTVSIEQKILSSPLS